MMRLEVPGARIRFMKVRINSDAQVLCQNHETLFNVFHGRLCDDLYRLGEGKGHQSLEFCCDMLNGRRGDLTMRVLCMTGWWAKTEKSGSAITLNFIQGTSLSMTESFSSCAMILKCNMISTEFTPKLPTGSSRESNGGPSDRWDPLLTGLGQAAV